MCQTVWREYGANLERHKLQNVSNVLTLHGQESRAKIRSCHSRDMRITGLSVEPGKGAALIR